MRRSILMEDSFPEILSVQLRTLAQLQRRAESLSGELAALKQTIARSVHNTPADPCADVELVGHETILIADDRNVECAIAREILEGFGYRILFAKGDLSDVVLDRAIDVLLLDLPWLDERHLSRLKIAQRLAGSARLVVCTPLPEGPARARLREAGVAAFVSKPFQPLTLARCIRHTLNAGGQ